MGDLRLKWRFQCRCWFCNSGGPSGKSSVETVYRLALISCNNQSGAAVMPDRHDSWRRIALPLGLAHSRAAAIALWGFLGEILFGSSNARLPPAASAFSVSRNKHIHGVSPAPAVQFPPMPRAAAAN